MLRREKPFVALTVFTLALGIGTAASVFGMADQILLRPLPGVHDGGRAAYLRIHAPEESSETKQHNLTTPELDELRAAATTLDGLASYGFSAFNVRAGEAGRPALATMIYGDFFGVLGVRALAGRLLGGPDTGFDADPLRVVISEALAGELFGTAAEAVDQTIRLNDRPVSVVGVAADGFRSAQRDVVSDLWVPFAAFGPLSDFPEEKIRGRAGAPHGLFVFRPREDAGMEAVRAQLSGILHRLARDEPRYDGDARLVHAEPRISPGIGLPPDLRPSVLGSLRLVAGAVALVLLIACANVANLLLFRNVARSGALTTRRALGASSLRIAREQLVQSLMLGVLGAGAGLGVGWLASLLLKGQALGGVPASDPLPLDGRVALFAAGASLLTAVIVGTVPAALAGRFDLAAALRESGLRHTGRLAAVRATLAAGQLALTLSLGVGALLLVRTVHNLVTADTGLDAGGVSYTLQSHTVALDRVGLDALAREVLAGIEAVPGVERAAMGPPDLDAIWGAGTADVGQPGAPDAEKIEARIVPVTPGWFEVFRVPAVDGRVFRDDDWAPGAATSVVLTSSLAQKLFDEGAAVGRRLAGVFGSGELDVIGVVGSLTSSEVPDRPKDIVFVTYAFPPPTSMFPLVIRTQTADSGLGPRIGRAITGVLPSEPVRNPQSITADRRHREQRTLGRLLGLLSALAATLAAVGLYGIIAFVVTGRTREFGIRLALGSEPSGIAKLVFRYGGSILGAGMIAGLAGAYALSRFLRNQLFGVGALDPASYLGGAAFLALVAALACWLPARRAMRVDPVTTLRRE
jgi:predicted permease